MARLEMKATATHAEEPMNLVEKYTAKICRRQKSLHLVGKSSLVKLPPTSVVLFRLCLNGPRTCCEEFCDCHQILVVVAGFTVGC